MSKGERTMIEVLMASGKYCPLKDLPNSPLPINLMAWFETAKQVMELPNVICHFIESKTLKTVSSGNIFQIGALGCAYGDNSFAFVGTDIPEVVDDRRTIIHEMLHLKGWFHGDVSHEDYEIEVERLYNLTKENLPIILCIER